MLSGGTTSFSTVSSGGAEYAFSSGTIADTSVDSGGYEIVSSGGAAISTSIDVSGAIDVAYLAYVGGGSATLNSSTDLLTITEGTDSYTQQLAGTYYATEYVTLAAGQYGGTEATLEGTACYCRGTRILTDRGEVAVEALDVGDRVVTQAGAARPIRWIGHRQLDLRRHPAPDQVQPIRIRADAVADGVPRRDLLLSPDHAVLVDGGLIAARRLVNRASIERDVQCFDVSYFHVELETHDILLAEALPVESYLDTGNRGLFANADAALILHPDLCERQGRDGPGRDGRDRDGQGRRLVGSCRPFVDDAATVEPIWRRLAARATMLGRFPPAELSTTADPGLHVVVGPVGSGSAGGPGLGVAHGGVAGGRMIRPTSVDAGRYTFVLPPIDGTVRLVSRAARPSEVQPWVEDRRRLGVMVARLTLRRGAAVEPIPLDHPDLSRGWWDVERNSVELWRWTNGDAEITLSAASSAVLEIVLAGSLAYPLGDCVETGPVSDVVSASEHPAATHAVPKRYAAEQSVAERSAPATSAAA